MNAVEKALAGAAIIKANNVHAEMDALQEAGVKAFQAGQKAKQRGSFRVSPYYEKPLLDKCFFAGYDQK